MKASRQLAPPVEVDVALSVLSDLRHHGIDTLFTVTGGPLMPLLKTCKSERLQRVVICRHETAAAVMAAAYFHDRGVPAVLALTSGPGVANAANGVIHALREEAALFVLSARPASAKVGRGAVQDFDSARFLATITKRSEQLLDPKQLAFLVDELLAEALAPKPGPVNLTVCADHWARAVGGGS
ncbi:MAG TPA: thiamine pyrophosphate-binding protein [Polyangiaceae bacterium]|nr:thiamine pyrophosphate-binding protein [Polyangiaceae bacterium]